MSFFNKYLNEKGKMPQGRFNYFYIVSNSSFDEFPAIREGSFTLNDSIEHTLEDSIFIVIPENEETFKFKEIDIFAEGNEVYTNNYDTELRVLSHNGEKLFLDYEERILVEKPKRENVAKIITSNGESIRLKERYKISNLIYSPNGKRFRALGASYTGYAIPYEDRFIKIESIEETDLSFPEYQDCMVLKDGELFENDLTK